MWVRLDLYAVFLFNKNINHKNIKSEICEILMIFKTTEAEIVKNTISCAENL